MEQRQIEFEGHQAVEIVTSKLKLIAVTDCGPRIAFLGRPRGENLLLWEEGKYFREQWELKGGHRVWITRPLADENEETYNLDQQSCTVKKLENGWDILGALDPANRIRKGLTLRILDEHKVEVDNYLVNSGNLIYSGGVWGLTCTIPTETTVYGIPLGEDNLWDYCRIVMFRKWETHTGSYNDDQFSFSEDMMFIHPKGRENKRMVQADRGIIALHDKERDILFAKRSTYDRAAQYPQGCNIAAYVGPENFMVEMETMGAEKTIKPGESLYNRETWVLESAAPGLSTQALEKLFK